MSVKLPNGSTMHVASAYSAAKAITAISNANPAVVTSEAHGFANGDVIELKCGASRINERIIRIASVTTDSYALEGIDTTDDTVYPTGFGVGSARKVESFIQIQQVLSSESAGGEQQFTQYQFLEDDQEKQLPTNKSAQSMTLSLADDPTLPGYIELAKANDDRQPRALRLNIPGGSKIYYNGICTVQETPSLTVNQVMAVQATISLQARPTRYAS